MERALLSVEDLHVAIGEKLILKGMNLRIDKGEVHVIMGPNGAGKSTLAHILMGNPRYTLVRGNMAFEGQNINSLKTDERARLGMFLSFQYPEEISGITLENFLRSSKGSITGKNPSVLSFYKGLKEKMSGLGMGEEYAKRNLNEGFSGGEKKKSEILQMLVLEPKLAILDETDSGLDIDAVRIVASGIREYMDGEHSAIIITHHRAILDYVKPDFVHILLNGRIIESGGAELIEIIENKGFDHLRESAKSGV
ncbi:MAG TPA: Fe-S cluster assembly ATPase SufC [Clostridia bacterium]|nr:Fe-S cluster assembly ATPase SufC [Clostridia bacterium]